MELINEDLFKEFAFWGSILLLKVPAMSLLTGKQRWSKKAFVNPEDILDKSSKITTDDVDVERVRRAHRNDLENVLPWFVMTAIWLTTGPSEFLAKTLIRLFVGARFGHTLFYAILPQQPNRAIAFGVGYFITIYQAISTMLYYL